MIKIDFQEIIHKNAWQDFVYSQPFFTFLQTWQWGEFQKLNNNKIFRVGGYQGSNLLLTALVIKIKAKRGTFLLCPHGPLINPSVKNQTALSAEASAKVEEIYQAFTDYLTGLAKKEQANFFRLNSVLDNNLNNAKMLGSFNYTFAPIHQHAETTWLLDISKPADELFQNMRKTTRYLIKRAEKEGVEIIKDNSQEGIKTFIQLHKKHALKTHYEPFSEKYIANLFESFRPEEISLKFAKYKGEIEAASIIIKIGRQTTYYLAVSENKHPQFSPAYLLQWQSILEAKQQGSIWYNFWGISPDDNPKHPLHGVSLFKKGFGGQILDLLHAYDLPINKKYYLNWLIETFRSKRRGYYYLKPKI